MTRSILRVRHVFLSAALDLGVSCTNEAREAQRPAASTGPAAPGTSSVAGSVLPAPPPETVEGDLVLVLSLEPIDDAEAPWLLRVVARNTSDIVLDDHNYRALERWSGDGWDPVAVVPYDRATPGELMACKPGAPCASNAVEAFVQPGELGEERAFRVWALDDGTYRMTEQQDAGTTVTSNRIEIRNGMLTE